ncbi:MAG: type II toxin-antitoxin system RelE/ParE family toxin [Gallionellaceae bacterium]
MKLRWLTVALDDLRGIETYVAQENPVAAQRVVASIRNETNALIKNGEVHILAVVHTSRRWPYQLSMLNKPD